MSAKIDHLLRLYGAGSEFNLGHLPTEGFHPATAGFDEVATRDAGAGLRALFRVDADVVERASALADEERPDAAAETIADRLRRGGRAIVVGCGATGRLALLVEKLWRGGCWRAGRPELGDRVVGVIAGGDYALVRSVEYFEDHPALATLQLEPLGISALDVVVCVTEGGETPFVLGAARDAADAGAAVLLLYSNPDGALASVERSARLIGDSRITALSVATGPMAISGSTRMQATSVELVVLAGVLEHALNAMIGRQHAGVWRQLADGVAAVHRSLIAGDVVDALAAAVHFEEAAYRRGRFANYAAADFALDVLTDTTERAPTFGIPPFRKSGDSEAAEPWAALATPYGEGLEAWESLLGRPPSCIDWEPSRLLERLGDDLGHAVAPLLSTITALELARFRIGATQRRDRISNGGHLVAVAGGGDTGGGRIAFLRDALRDGAAVGASRALVVCGTEPVVARLRTDLASEGADVVVHINVADGDLLLEPLPHLTLKLALNALSTCTMARMGRVIGNCMACVTPTNSKLVDRSTRYVAELAGLSYEDARRELRAAFLHVAPRMTVGAACPPVVPLAVTAVRHGVSLEAAEAALEYGRPHPAQAVAPSS